MNERIKELAEQAGEKVFDYWSSEDESPYIYVLNEEKFAELILKDCFECIDIMEKLAESNNSSIPKDYDKHTYLETLDTMRGLLKTHFGVE